MSARLNTFRHALMSHADILDVDRDIFLGSIGIKLTKNVAVIYEKTVKKPVEGCVQTERRVAVRSLTLHDHRPKYHEYRNVTC